MQGLPNLLTSAARNNYQVSRRRKKTSPKRFNILNIFWQQISYSFLYYTGLCTASLEESLRAIRGSVPWMAPEVIKQSGESEKRETPQHCHLRCRLFKLKIWTCHAIPHCISIDFLWSATDCWHTFIFLICSQVTADHLIFGALERQ